MRVALNSLSTDKLVALDPKNYNSYNKKYLQNNFLINKYVFIMLIIIPPLSCNI